MTGDMQLSFYNQESALLFSHGFFHIKEGGGMNRRGFTLVELLVVIAIIGILAAMVLSSLSSARSKARDTARKNDLAQIRTALEQHAADKGGSYPGATTADIWTKSDTTGAGVFVQNSPIKTLETSGYLSTVPLPQRALTEEYGYITNAANTPLFGANTTIAANTQYALEATLERPVDSAKPIWQVSSKGTAQEVKPYSNQAADDVAKIDFGT